MSAATIDLHDETEAETVIRWRLAELTRAGYDWCASMHLAARRDIDLHRAADLLARGCPVDTAMRILV